MGTFLNIINSIKLLRYTVKGDSMSIDPILPLSISLAEGKRAYAVFIGSGISKEAGIPTGLEIFYDTIELIYKGKKNVEKVDDNAVLEWFEKSEFKYMNYSTILEELCNTKSERKNFLERFFQGKKPTDAHNVIADMVEKGLIKAIITTNFDRLMESALEERGISPDIISDETDILKKTDREHSNCWILKLHGDYKNSNIKNTEKELEKLNEEIEEIFMEVLNKYGVIVIGYSGSDEGVMSCFEKRINPRYTMYWLSRNSVNDDVKTLIENQDGKIIKRNSADDFLNELSRKTQIYLTHKKGETPEFFIQEIKDFIKTQNYIDLNETMKEQIKVIKAQFVELVGIAYDEKDNKTISRFNEFNRYFDRLTSIGLVLIEYNEYIENTKTDFFEEFLKLFEEFYYLPDTIMHEFSISGKVHYNPKIVYIVRSSLYYLYHYLGAYALKKENYKICKKIIGHGIYLKNMNWKFYYFWQILNSSKSATTFEKQEKLANYFIKSYDQSPNDKTFLKEFFNSKNDFTMHICQFNYIITLLGIEMEKRSGTNITYVYPFFATYLTKGYIKRFLMKMKEDDDLLETLANLFRSDINEFKNDKYPLLCNEIIKKISYQALGHGGYRMEYKSEVEDCGPFGD